MLAPQSSNELLFPLKGLRQSPRTRNSLPKSRRVHYMHYVGLSALALCGSMMTAFILAVSDDIEHFGSHPKYDAYRAQSYWTSVCIILLPLLIAIWMYGWKRIHTIAHIAVRFGSSYADAYYVHSTPFLRKIAQGITVPEEFSSLVDQAKRHDQHAIYLDFIRSFERTLAGHQCAYAQELRDLMAKQRAEIEAAP